MDCSGACRKSQLLPITLGVVLVLWLQPYGAPSKRSCRVVCIPDVCGSCKEVSWFGEAASGEGGNCPCCVVVAGKGVSLGPPLLCCTEQVHRGVTARAGLCCEGTWAGSALVVGVSQFAPEVRVRGVWWLWASPWATLWGRWVAGQGSAQECGVGLGAGQPWPLAVPPLAGQGGSSSSGLASAHPQDAGEGQNRTVLGISSSSGA